MPQIGISKKYKAYPIEEIETNLRNIFRKANEHERRIGLGWYIEANLYLQQIADHFNLPLKLVCAITAVLSPSNPWNSNIKDTYNCIKFKGKITSTTYPPNIQKAKIILKTKGSYHLVSGLKVPAFLDNLLNPKTSEAITIDTHIFRGALNNSNLEVTGSLPITYFREIDKVIRLIANEEQFLPSQIQAIIWVTWKRLILARDTNFDQKFFMF